MPPAPPPPPPGNLAGGNFNWNPGITGVAPNPWFGGGTPATAESGVQSAAWGGTGTGGNSIASNALQQVTGPEEQQAQNAQNLAGYYQGMAPGALGIAAPTIANASQADLNQSRGQLNTLANNYMAVANGQGPMGQLAENQYQQALGQSMNSNLAMAHSGGGGAIGAAGNMRAAMEANAGTSAGAAAQSGVIAAQQQQAGLAGAAGAYGQLGSMNLSQYQTAQQIAQEQALIKQQQTGQNEGFFSNLTSAGSNQQQIANQSTQSLGALGVQTGLGEAGTAVGAENATTNMIGMGSNLGSAASSALSGAGSALSSSDANAKTAVQSEGASPTTAVGSANGPGAESTVTSSSATAPQIAESAAMGAVKGAVQGASTGASIGSVIPGIGNAIGALVGGAAGGLAGGFSAGHGTAEQRNVSGVSTPGGAFQADPSSAGPQVSGMGLAGTGVSALETGASVSDERAKSGARDQGQLARGAQGTAADSFLDHLHPYSYQYKDPRDEPRPPTGGRYLGVMAQDLQAVPEIGHQLVVDTPQGKKVSIGAGLAATMAGLGRVDERLKALEGEDGDMGEKFNSAISPSRGKASARSSSLAEGMSRLAERVKELEGRR